MLTEAELGGCRVWLAGLLVARAKVFDRAYPMDMVAAEQPGPVFHRSPTP